MMRRAVMSGLTGAVVLIIGLMPILFLDWARRSGSLGKLDVQGLVAMAVLVVAIAVGAGLWLYRAGANAGPADRVVATFLGLVIWTVGVLTLVPGLLFLRLTDDRSLDQYGARFFLEWALVYLLIAAAAYALGRWSLRSLVRESRRSVISPLP